MTTDETPKPAPDPEQDFFDGKPDGPSAPGADPGPAGPSFSDDVNRVGRRQPSTWRSPLLMVVLVAACGWLAWSLMPDVRYFLAPTTPIDLGKAETANLSQARANTFVKVRGIPSVLKVTYRQFGDQYEVYYLLGSRVFVRQKLAKKHAGSTGVWSVFDGSGRLVDIDRSREYANIKHFYAERGFDFREPTWMVLSGERPRQHWLYPTVLVVLGLIALFNLFLLGRRLVLKR